MKEFALLASIGELLVPPLPVSLFSPMLSVISKQFVWPEDVQIGPLDEVKLLVSDVDGKLPEFSIVAVAEQESPGDRFETVRVIDDPSLFDQEQLEYVPVPPEAP